VVGAGTVAADDPELTVRDPHGPTPSRIVIDSELRIAPEARIWSAWNAEVGEVPAEQSPIGNFARDRQGRYRRSPRLILATTTDAANRTEPFRAIGWEVWTLPGQDGHLSLSAFAERATQEGFHHLLVEAGPGLAHGFLDAGLVDALSLYLAPKILGGSHGWTGAFRSSLEDAESMEPIELRTLGADICWKLQRAGIVEKLEQQLRQIG
jgi:diaminohydroxyphosphoribosylaminopyrimidine deaminase/5-amino-6-(5-phosphoribosylamino)uracil reductase